MLPMLMDGDEPEGSMATPFEQWCEAAGLHPEDSRAWPLYEASIETGAQAPAAS